MPYDVEVKTICSEEDREKWQSRSGVAVTFLGEEVLISGRGKTLAECMSLIEALEGSDSYSIELKGVKNSEKEEKAY